MRLPRSGVGFRREAFSTRDFVVYFTGDLYDPQGNPASDLGWDLLDHAPQVRPGFLAD
jgi:hypothetical protein